MEISVLIRSFSISLFTFMMSFSVLSAVAETTTKTIIVQGVGSNVEFASKNAAENALTQIVGTFIDTETQLKKQSEITNGIKNETKSIDTKTRSYSQGSVKSFELVSSEQQGNLISVIAKVEVRIEDFRAYIKTLAEGKAEVNEGLFAKIATNKNNSENASDLIFAKIIPEIISGEVVEIIVGEPQPLKDSGARAYFVEGLSDINCEEAEKIGIQNACKD